MPVRSADAEWQGTLREGAGRMKFGSGAFEGAYSFTSRFENGTGTNPEELIGAAHAGCYSMALSGGLTRAGHPPTSVRTVAKVHIGPAQGGGMEIPKIELEVEAEVPGISDAEFQTIAAATKDGCPVSKALKAVPITLVARLKS